MRKIWFSKLYDSFREKRRTLSTALLYNTPVVEKSGVEDFIARYIDTIASGVHSAVKSAVSKK